MTNAYIYIRFSTRAQDKGSSKDRQLELCRGFAKQHEMTVIEPPIMDLGRSAWKGDHLKSGELGLFAERVRAGGIEPNSILIVEKLDRLSRREIEEARQWMLEMTSYGLRIAVVDGGKVYDNHTLRTDLVGIIEQLLRADLAHKESAQKSERVASAWSKKQEKARTGKILTTACPAWLSVSEDGQFIINEKRAAVVRRIFQLSADGLGFWGIAKRLTQDEVLTWGKKRGSTREGWTHTYVSLIINGGAAEGDHYPSRLVDGRRTKGHAVIRDYYPRIVDADLAARGKAATANRKWSGGRQSTEVRNLFAGMVKCAECDGRMTLRRQIDRGKAYQYLYCDNQLRGRSCSNKGAYPYDTFENAALDTVLYLALDDRFFRSSEDSQEYIEKLARAEKALTDKQQERDNVRSLLRRFPDDEQLVSDWQTLTLTVKGLETERDSMANELARARGARSPSEHLKRVSDVRAQLSSDDVDERFEARLRVRDAMKGLVSVVRCGPVQFTDDAKPEKRSTIVIAGGAVIASFDPKGKQVFHRNVLPQCADAEDFISGPAREDAIRMFARDENEIERNRIMLDKVLKRSPEEFKSGWHPDFDNLPNEWEAV